MLKLVEDQQRSAMFGQQRYLFNCRKLYNRYFQIIGRTQNDTCTSTNCTLHKSQVTFPPYQSYPMTFVYRVQCMLNYMPDYFTASYPQHIARCIPISEHLEANRAAVQFVSSVSRKVVGSGTSVASQFYGNKRK